jgi:hypothetical protein
MKSPWTLPGPTTTRTGRRATSSTVVLLAARATTLVPAGPSQAVDTGVTVDFSTAGGAPTYRASGMIYGMCGCVPSRRSTRARTECTVCGRPGRQSREAAAWRRASRSRCHRSTVTGRISGRSLRSTSFGSWCSSAAMNARSPGWNRTFSFPIWRSGTLI